MKVYTVSPCLLERVIAKDIDSTRLIFKFFTDSELTIALDDKNYVIERYSNMISTSGNSTLSEWLDLLGKCNKFEVIKLDETFEQEHLFMEICYRTFGVHNMLVGSKQNFVNYPVVSDSSVKYKDKEIFLLDTIEALNKIDQKCGMYIHSVNNSSITESGNINNNK